MKLIFMLVAGLLVGISAARGSGVIGELIYPYEEAVAYPREEVIKMVKQLMLSTAFAVLGIWLAVTVLTY